METLETIKPTPGAPFARVQATTQFSASGARFGMDYYGDESFGRRRWHATRRRRPFKRKPPKPRDPAFAAAMDRATSSWWHAVTRDGCAMCKAHGVPQLGVLRRPDLLWVEGAHIIAKRFLTFEQKWDRRVGIGLCRYHHARHDHHAERVPRAVVLAAVPGVLDFMAEHGLGGSSTGTFRWTTQPDGRAAREPRGRGGGV